jgi:hypothetical protein
MLKFYQLIYILNYANKYNPDVIQRRGYFLEAI